MRDVHDDARACESVLNAVLNAALNAVLNAVRVCGTAGEDGRIHTFAEQLLIPLTARMRGKLLEM